MATQASTSGTAINFTGIPSGVKRITMNLYNVSIDTNSVSLLIQLGSGSYATSGYSSVGAGIASAVGFSATPSTAGFIIAIFEAASFNFGSMVFTHVGSNIWVGSGSTGSIVAQGGSYNLGFTNSGQIALGGTIDRIRMTTTSGSANFDSGSINVMYET
jgi:hypothetical protein